MPLLWMNQQLLDQRYQRIGVPISSLTITGVDPATIPLHVDGAAGQSDFLQTLDVNGVRRMDVGPDGAIRSTGQVNIFGRGSLGAPGVPYIQIGDDATGALVAALHTTATDTQLTLRAKGAGSTVIQRGDGTTLMSIVGAALGGTQSALQLLFNALSRTLELGLADSGGVGYKMVRVVN